MKKLLLLLVTTFVLLVSCEKDENGMYLCPNYCTATINGEEYSYRESYALPLIWGVWPSASIETVQTATGMVQMLKIFAKLSPAIEKGNPEESEFYISLYIRDFKTEESLNEQTYTFTQTEITNNIGETLSQENINIAVISPKFWELGTTASGSIRFSNHEKEGCNHEVNKCFEADITLNVEGEKNIEVVGHLCTHY